jgi:predicted nucleic-acid-binding Zn-ribbon protein
MKVLAKEPRALEKVSLIDCFENNFIIITCDNTWFLEIFENQSYQIYKAQIRTDKVWCHL